MKHPILNWGCCFCILICSSYISFGQSEINKIKTRPVDSISLALHYPLKDKNNNTIRLSSLKGKLVIVDVWFTGCGACISVNNALKAVHDSLKNYNLTFVSISIDKDKKLWLQSISKTAKPNAFNNWAGKYCPAKGTQTFYTGGSGQNNAFIKEFVPNGFYPQLILIGADGKLLSANLPRPDPKPKVLIDVIKKYL